MENIKMPLGYEIDKTKSTEDTDEEYKGKRIKRGLFKTAGGNIINADVNGGLNILRKAVGKFDYDPIEVCSTPVVWTVGFQRLTV